jgi:FkbM family methyltransferase
VIKKIIKEHFLGRSRYQPFWERLHAWALQGMNVCAGDGSVDEGEIWVLKYVDATLRKDKALVVFDVGANTGLYGAEVVRQFKDNLRLYAFEPSQEVFTLLAARFSGDKNVECLNFGFSDCEESATLYSFAGQSGLSSVYDRVLFSQLGPNGDQHVKGEENIKLRTLDSFCVERNIDRVSLLKLDIEGHELRVLRGASGLIQTGAVDFIQFEFGGTNVDSKTFLRDFFDVLQPNYKLYRIVTDGLRSIEPYAERSEIFLLTNYLAVSRELSDPFRMSGMP